MAARKKPAPKRGASRYQAPSKQPVPAWIWLACGLAIGGFMTFLFSLEPGRDEIRRDKAEQASGKRTEKASDRPPSEPAKPKYDFYTLLPESEVMLPPRALEPAPTPAQQQPVSPEEAARIEAARAEAALNGQPVPPPPVIAQPPATTQHFLQAGSFRRQGDAESLRAQIILLGADARVESGKVRDEVWHRVLIGPFASREQQAQAQKTLTANGLRNLLPQQRQSR